MDLQEAFDAGFLKVKEYLDAKFAAFETRIAQMESSFRYLGVWSDDRLYERGNFVSHNGSVWHANARTRARPGDGCDWQLAVKKGVDAR